MTILPTPHPKSRTRPVHVDDFWSWPCVMERRDPKAMTAAEAGRFLDAARKIRKDRNGEDVKDRYHALWTLLLTGGLRPGEALGLLWEDVDSDGGRIHIQRSLTRQGVEKWRLERPKTPRARRTVVLPETAMHALRDWRKDQITERLKAGPDYENHGLVFTTSSGKPLDQTNLNVQFKVNCTDTILLQVSQESREDPSSSVDRYVLKDNKRWDGVFALRSIWRIK